MAANEEGLRFNNIAVITNNAEMIMNMVISTNNGNLVSVSGGTSSIPARTSTKMRTVSINIDMMKNDETSVTIVADMPTNYIDSAMKYRTTSNSVDMGKNIEPAVKIVVGKPMISADTATK